MPSPPCPSAAALRSPSVPPIPIRLSSPAPPGPPPHSPPCEGTCGRHQRLRRRPTSLHVSGYAVRVLEYDAFDPSKIDTSVAHPARMYDYYLGGKTHFAADRAAADTVLAVLPEGRDMAIA